ncbi:hypothetical protein AVEN_187104-1 [Araneus ventricosus]|uniref:Uncharacterized protein n=1 Tax=Araneus ventricosus TaxID=182803 RepID=A0A4Y2EW86_ARAVE|nr:hypothetical protein AVEN_187104-1 [Araneus ventricosus]
MREIEKRRNEFIYGAANVNSREALRTYGELFTDRTTSRVFIVYEIPVESEEDIGFRIEVAFAAVLNKLGVYEKIRPFLHRLGEMCFEIPAQDTENFL